MITNIAIGLGAFAVISNAVSLWFTVRRRESRQWNREAWQLQTAGNDLFLTQLELMASNMDGIPCVLEPLATLHNDELRGMAERRSREGRSAAEMESTRELMRLLLQSGQKTTTDGPAEQPSESAAQQGVEPRYGETVVPAATGSSTSRSRRGRRSAGETLVKASAKSPSNNVPEGVDRYRQWLEQELWEAGVDN